MAITIHNKNRKQIYLKARTQQTNTKTNSEKHNTSTTNTKKTKIGKRIKANNKQHKTQNQHDSNKKNKHYTNKQKTHTQPKTKKLNNINIAQRQQTPKIQKSENSPKAKL